MPQCFKKLQKSRGRQPGNWTLTMLCCLLLAVGFSACDSAVTPAKPVTTSQANVTCSAHSNNPVTLNMSYGSEKQAWIEDVVADFNSRNVTACDGPITVKATPKGSGQSMQDILAGSDQPDVWSPAGAVWLTLLNSQWHDKHGSDLIGTGANDAPSVVSSPVVIAMWKPQAEALGWPQKALGWADIAKLSTDPQGWKTYGHPEFGQFKFGHTHPGYSNSGLDAVIAMNYAATNKLDGLTADDVNQQSTKDFVANVESSVIHYGDSTGFFADKMFTNGPGYLSATVMYESLVVEANDGKKYPHLAYPVVAIYPKEGTFYSDHPFATLKASWVTPAKQAAAQAFRSFLLDAPQQNKALKYGFRPADVHMQLAAPLDSAHGVDAHQPSSVLQIPNSDVIQAIENSWQQQRRRVDVMLILDRSGSMNDPVNGATKIDGAKAGLKDFVGALNDQDRVGFTVFSDDEQVVTPVSPLGAKRQDLITRINNVVATGYTMLFDTVSDQVKALKALPSTHIKALIVLTDGVDNKSKVTLDQLVKQVTPTGEDAGNAIKLFTIAYGDPSGKDIDVPGLTKIAEGSGGKEYSGTPQNIKDIYNQISLFF